MSPLNSGKRKIKRKCSVYLKKKTHDTQKNKDEDFGGLSVRSQETISNIFK